MVRRQDFNKKKNYILALLIDIVGYSFIGLTRFFRKGKDLDNPERILVIRLDHIGDVLLSTPSLRALRKLYPKAQISCLVGSWAKEVLKRNPNVDEVTTFNPPWLQRGNSKRTSSLKLFRFALSLRKRNFDLSIDFRPDIRNLFFDYLIGAKRRVGYGFKGGGFFLTDVVPYRDEKHILERNADVLRVLGIDNFAFNLEIHFSNDDEIYVQKLLENYDIHEGDLVIGLNPGAGYSVRNWTNEGFARLADELTKKYGAKIIIIGTNDAQALVGEIISLMRTTPVNITGKTHLKQLIALIARLNLLITVDSAPRHIANAIGTPVITLRHGVDSQKLWSSYSNNDHVIALDLSCSPCGEEICPKGTRDCMTLITPEEVLRVAKKVTKNE